METYYFFSALGVLDVVNGEKGRIRCSSGSSEMKKGGIERKAWESYLHWLENYKEILSKINVLIREIKKYPFRGIGKTEPLRGNFF